MTLGKLTILVSLFTLLSLFSVLALFYTHQFPTEQEIVTPLYTYEQTGTYDYTARLRPNTIYDNRTTLKPGEGILYTEIVESIDTSFTYTFQGNATANITITYSIDVSAASSQWTKNIYTIPVKTENFTGTAAEFAADYTFNITVIEALKETLEIETRTSVPNYNLTITPEIVTTAKTEVYNRTLNITLDTFTPTLAYTFQYSRVSTSSLEHRTTGARTLTERIYHSSVRNQQYATYGFSGVSFAGLVTTMWFYRKSRPSIKPAKPIEEIISPFQEVIAESSGEPTYKEQPTTIAVKSLEDLVKVADWIGKPVISYQRPKRSKDTEVTHVFYVLDGTTQYECTITAPTMIREEREAEIERENSD